MNARILDGKVVAQAVSQRAQAAAASLKEQGVIPHLAAVLVGEDPASQTYVRIKGKAFAEAGLSSATHNLPGDVSRELLLARVRQLNEDPAVHGILVQLPLPGHLDPAEVVMAVDPRKDVDGLHPVSSGLLLQGLPGLRPCTPAGIMELLRHYEIDLAGKRAVVVGRSNIVGKPMAIMLLAAHATVTICHTRTQDLPAVTRQADVLVVAAGRRHVLDGSFVQPGAVVVDVGMHRHDGKLAGDVEPESVGRVAGALTPVPGGVGPLTVAMLLHNTVQAALAQTASQ